MIVIDDYGVCQRIDKYAVYGWELYNQDINKRLARKETSVPGRAVVQM